MKVMLFIPIVWKWKKTVYIESSLQTCDRKTFTKLCSGQSILNLCARRAQKFIGIILVRGQQKSPSCSIFFNHQI